MSVLPVAIIGPTASGKTSLALELARYLGKTEIISADAMTFYRGMDIGTAKATPAERSQIPHHLLDTLEVTDEASVAEYQKQSREIMESLLQRGIRPLLVGGSGLYLRAALDEMHFPGTDSQIRFELTEQAQKEGPLVMHQRLAALDPIAAANIAPNNVRRTVRALEVIRLTGEPFSAKLPSYQYHRPAIQIGLRLPFEELEERIARRTEQMLQAGLINETEQLLKAGLKSGKTASRATGYAEAIAVIEGKMTLSEAAAAITLATRKLAKKQLKWFKRDPRIHWIDATENTTVRALEIIQQAETQNQFAQNAPA